MVVGLLWGGFGRLVIAVDGVVFVVVGVFLELAQ